MPPFKSYFWGLNVGQFLTKSSKIAHLCLEIFLGKRLISILKTWVQKTVLLECFQTILTKHFKNVYNYGYENQLLLNICKTFSEQTLTKHCQDFLFKCFVYNVYQTFHDECLKNISRLTFISSAIL